MRTLVDSQDNMPTPDHRRSLLAYAARVLAIAACWITYQPYRFMVILYTIGIIVLTIVLA